MFLWVKLLKQCFILIKGWIEMNFCNEKVLIQRQQELVNNHLGYKTLKRILDVIISIIGLALAFPIMILVAIAIKIEDPKGAIMFTQERNGKYPTTFKMYKFRSMYTDAEQRLQELIHLNEQTGPVFKMKNDPRITKVGRIIRKTSIDELPQLINVLKGDMSIVGPRPALPREVELYNEHQIQRLFVKPGITCIWQVSGRNNIGFEQWVEMDINYIKNRSIWLDLKLILLTIPALLGDENAS